MDVDGAEDNQTTLRVKRKLEEVAESPLGGPSWWKWYSWWKRWRPNSCGQEVCRSPIWQHQRDFDHFFELWPVASMIWFFHTFVVDHDDLRWCQRWRTTDTQIKLWESLSASRPEMINHRKDCQCQIESRVCKMPLREPPVAIELRKLFRGLVIGRERL